MNDGMPEGEDEGVQACARCTKPFTCGLKAGSDACWCADMPWVVPLDPTLSCLCPACLEVEVRRRSYPGNPNP